MPAATACDGKRRHVPIEWFNWTKRRGSEDTAAGEGRFAEEIAEPVELEVAPAR